MVKKCVIIQDGRYSLMIDGAGSRMTDGEVTFEVTMEMMCCLQGEGGSGEEWSGVEWGPYLDYGGGSGV